jgi:hypothetical protein
MPAYNSKSNILRLTNPSAGMIPGFWESVIQQSIDPRAFPVWIPLAFGLVVGLAYVIASAARRRR